MRNYFIIIIAVLVIVGISRMCGNSRPTTERGYTSQTKPTYTVSPVDRFVRDLSDEKSYSIVLYDMELDENSRVYKHKYRITKNPLDSASKPYTTEWINVDEVFFAENVDNMGLELASKSPDGKVHKTPSPAGFNGYVGNDQYGTWKPDNQGNKFWEYYGQYAFMNSMLNASQPRVYHTTYTHYSSYRNDPYTSHKPYYGTKDNSYGTNSPETKKSNPSFFERKQQQAQMSSFKQKVAQNPRQYTRANRDPSTTYTKAGKTSSTPSSSYSSSTSSSKPSTSSSYKSSTSSSKPSTSSSYKSSTSSSTPSRTSSAPNRPSTTSSSSSRSSSSYSAPSRSSSSSRSSAPSRSSSSSSSSRSSSRRK